MRKKLAGVAVLVAAQLIAVACYVSSSRTCPGYANRGNATCVFDTGVAGSSGSGGYSYPWVTAGGQGMSGAQSDNTNHCHYTCPNNTGFWVFPGAVTKGTSCGGG